MKFCIKRFIGRHGRHEQIILKRACKIDTNATLNVELVQRNDEVTIEPNLAFRDSGKLRTEVEQEEEKSRKQFARLVHAASITQTEMH